MISTDPLAPGSVYTASVDDQGKVGLYRLEVGCSPGTGKLKLAGGVEGVMKESIQRAFAYLMGQKVKMGVGQQVDTTDFHVEAIDLLSNHVPCSEATSRAKQATRLGPEALQIVVIGSVPGRPHDGPPVGVAGLLLLALAVEAHGEEEQVGGGRLPTVGLDPPLQRLDRVRPPAEPVIGDA
jgi:predicted ATP-dependent Lon-type protease